MKEASATAGQEPSLSLTRVNADSSWVIELDGTRLLLDPWLEGFATIVHPVIHQASLVGPRLKHEELPQVDTLVISHPFADHLSRPSLRKLPRDLPAFAPAVVRPFLKLLGGFASVRRIPNGTRGGQPVTTGSIALAWFRAAAPLDTTHNALILRGVRSGATVMYCPHGMLPPDRTLAAVEAYLGGRLDVLLCSLLRLDLPWYLGGVANLGVDAGIALANRLKPRYLMQTHDGEKPDVGFIARAATITPCRDLAAAVAGRSLAPAAVTTGVGERWQPA